MNKKICISILLFFGLVLNIILDFNIRNYIILLSKCFNTEIILSSKLYACICFIIAFISILIIIDILFVIFKKPNENKGINFKTEDGTFGTAAWMSYQEVSKILGLNDIPGIILGEYNKQIVKLPFNSYLNKNICVFGSSRKYENNRICFNKFIRAIKI